MLECELHDLEQRVGDEQILVQCSPQNADQAGNDAQCVLGLRLKQNVHRVKVALFKSLKNCKKVKKKFSKKGK